MKETTFNELLEAVREGAEYLRGKKRGSLRTTTRCKKHPKYQAKRAPTADCPTCRKLWAEERKKAKTYRFTVHVREPFFKVPIDKLYEICPDAALSTYPQEKLVIADALAILLSDLLVQTTAPNRKQGLAYIVNMAFDILASVDTDAGICSDCGLPLAQHPPEEPPILDLAAEGIVPPEWGVSEDLLSQVEELVAGAIDREKLGYVLILAIQDEAGLATNIDPTTLNQLLQKRAEHTANGSQIPENN